MVSLTDVPDGVGSFGQEFNYSVWTAGTVVTLCNVPWNSDYRDIVRFDNQAALDSYINDNAGPVITFNNLTYARAGMPVRINAPFNKVYKYNYLRVTNPTQPVPGNDEPRTFYYFIHDITYVAPNTTELGIQLDVWQTFGRNVTFGNSYIERGHIGIANKNQDRDNGREYLTVPEGMDIGGEYQIANVKTKTIGASDYRDPNVSFDIIVATTVSLIESYGDINNPVLNTAKGSNFQGLPNGAELYWFRDVSEFKLLMEYLSDKPWISQGIISIYAVPNVETYQLECDTHHGFSDGPEGLVIRRLKNEGYPETEFPMGNIKDEILGSLPARYRHLKKFATHPYSSIELTTYSGSPLVLKPECIPTPFLGIRMLLHLSLPSPRIALYPAYYNAGPNWMDRQGFVGDPGGDNAEFLDMVTGITDLPTFSLVNNSYIGFMASNRNALAYSHQSADWSQQKALNGADLSYQQSQSAMQSSRDQVNLQNATAAQQTALSNQTAGFRAVQSGVNSAIGGIGGGAMGAVGAVVGIANAGASYAIETNQNNQSLAISQGAALKGNAIQLRNQGFVADTNKSFAAYAAQGDYANSIAAINAKVQDAKLVQPTTSGQIGGDAFNLAMYRWAIHAKYKTIQSGAIHAIGEFWLRYGYSINRFAKMPANLSVMSKFTYWKLRETYISSSTCPEMYKQTIRGIFEKGVTVWKNPADIGTIDLADNVPLEGVTL